MQNSGKTGRITHLVINGTDFATRNRIYYIIATMPAWSPAISHNRTLDYTVSLSLF